MHDGNYWLQRSLASRRRFLVGGSAATAAFLAACSGSNNNTASKPSNAGSGATVSTSPAAAAPSGGSPAASAAGAELGSAAETAGVLPGTLTPAEKAAATSPEAEYRLKYIYSKFRNLPGQKQGPKYGGILKITESFPINWDVLGSGGSGEGQFGAVYSGLVDMYNDDWHDVHRGIRPVGDRAQKWEQPDPTTIVFTLWPGVKFADKPPVNGRALTPDDVRISYEALRKAPYQGPNYVDVKAIEVVGDNQVRFTFNRPAAYFINNLLSQKHVVVPNELLGTDIAKTTAVGSGPMTLKTWKPGQFMEYEKNPTYFKKDARTGMQLPYLDGIQATLYTDRNTMLAAWKNGQMEQVAFAYGLQEPKSMGVFTDPNAVFQVVTPSPWGMTHVAFKLEKAPWNDVRVRRALSLALNRKDMVDGLCDGLAAEGSYPLDWTFFKDAKTGTYQEWPWTKDQLGQFQKFDAGQSKQLLTAAGFSSQNPLVFECVGVVEADPGGYLLRHQTHLAMVDQWKQALGDLVQPKFIALDALTYSTAPVKRDYNDLFLSWLTGPAYEPDGFLYAQMNSKSTYNIYGIKDPDIDQWTDAQRIEMDNDKRQVLWQQVMNKDLDQCYRVFTYHGYKTQARRANIFNVIDAMNAWAPGFRGPAQWGWKLS